MKVRWVVRCADRYGRRVMWVHGVVRNPRMPPGTPNASFHPLVAVIYETKAEAEAVAALIAPAYDWLVGRAHPRRVR